MIHATMIISILSLLATMAGEATRGRQKGHRYGYEYDEFKNLVDPYLIISTGFIHTIILSLFSSRTKVHKSRKQKVITTISLFFLPFFLRSRNFELSRHSIAEHEVAAALSSCGMSSSMEVGYLYAVKYILLT